MYREGSTTLDSYSIRSSVAISNTKMNSGTSNNTPAGVLVVTTYPPRECGIATYSQDLIVALNNKFSRSFTISVCALESDTEQHVYSDNVKYTLNTDDAEQFDSIAASINRDVSIGMVLIQHEFGLFRNNESKFQEFLVKIAKPVIIVFHTVLPDPDDAFRLKVTQIAGAAKSIIVMTHSSAEILERDYNMPPAKIEVIPHGTHLVPHGDKLALKAKYQVAGRKVLSTFGLLSSGKSIETTLEALPDIVRSNPSVLFLIIGKTHPSIVKNEGEKYREMLIDRVDALKLNNHVRFINRFLPLGDLLEYLQLTDIYLFTSHDPHQAVSGTFSYAISCGCPIISTPIPHAREVLGSDTGIIIDFNSSAQLAAAVNSLLSDEHRRKEMISNGLHRMASTAWENAAIAHALLFEENMAMSTSLNYNIPKVNLDHLKKMTTSFGIIQFSRLNQPDIDSGYTLDDNARAMIAMCRYYELREESKSLDYIRIYLSVIQYCQQADGRFLNYIDDEGEFTAQNNDANLADSNGRAIWALGYLISLRDLLPAALVEEAISIMSKALPNVENMYSTRAMAFAIKGLYYSNLKNDDDRYLVLISLLADRLMQMYRHEASDKWRWFESYLTYGNSLLPEAMLCAWLTTGITEYRDIAKSSFDFLMTRIFKGNVLTAISNKYWLIRGNEQDQPAAGGEQPIEIAYTIMALDKFMDVFNSLEYLNMFNNAFSWFLGNNHLHRIVYNPCTGGCYDGLEEHNVNLNQGAESTLSYLIARLIVAKAAAKFTSNRLIANERLVASLPLHMTNV